MKIEKIKGFRDQYPEDMEPRKKIFEVSEKVSESYGFRKIDPPSLEYLDLYRLKSGEELVGQTFSFTDRGGREVTMIPEATPSVVRMLVSRKDLPKPVRWFSFPKVWRYEEPQAGRLREHYQFNADIFGVDTAEADAEIIGLAARILDTLSLEGIYELRINNRNVMEYLFRDIGIEDSQPVFSIIDRFRKISRDEFYSELSKVGVSSGKADILYDLVSQVIPVSELPEKVKSVARNYDGIKELVERIVFTEKLIRTYTKSAVKFDFSIIRGLSYYTGIVFEAFDIKGELRSILGGGRYNNLAGLMSEQDIPAVGFGMGDVVIEILLRRSDRWSYARPGKTYYICTMSGEEREYAFGIMNRLRQMDINAIPDVSDRGLSAQLKAASGEKADFAVIIGRKEREQGEITLKDLATGKQSVVSTDDFLRSLSI